MSRTIKTALIAAFALASLAPSALAGTPSRIRGEQVSIAIPYGDLDLSTRAGAHAALKRIQAAALEICGGRPDPKQLALNVAYSACQSDVVSRGVEAFNAPMVTALYNRKPGSMTTASR
jgi:UrcA family protein